MYILREHRRRQRLCLSTAAFQIRSVDYVRFDAQQQQTRLTYDYSTMTSRSATNAR